VSSSKYALLKNVTIVGGDWKASGNRSLDHNPIDCPRELHGLLLTA
jgi:hypothetical protein